MKTSQKVPLLTHLAIGMTMARSSKSRWRASPPSAPVKEDVREMRVQLEKMLASINAPEGYVESHSLLARGAHTEVPRFPRPCSSPK